MKFKKYDKYKKTQIEWIGEIPEHWEVVKMKYIGDLYSGLSGKSAVDFNQPDNPNNKPYIPFSNILNNEKINPRFLDYVVINKEDNQNMVKKGDLFFLMSSENYDDVGKSSVLESELGETYLNSFCKGFRLSNKSVEPSFLNWLLLSYPNRCRLMIEANGFTRINLKQDKIKEYYVYTPPLSEQIQISSYLDNKTSLIDKLINNNKKLIKLLEEKRTALINKVITKGLDPNVKMKDSGIEWIGEIPEHWKVTKLKYESLINTESLSSNTDPNFSFLYIDIGSVRKDGSLRKLQNYIFSEAPSRARRVVSSGDVIVSTVRTYLRAITSISEKYKNCIASTGFCVITPSSDVATNFLKFYVRSKYFIQKVVSISEGVSYPGTTATDISNIKFLLPNLEEQERIALYLTKETNKYQETIELLSKQNLFLKEYRQSLISNVITGKIDVRNN